MNNFIYFLSKKYQIVCSVIKHGDGIAALVLRLYLVPIFWMAGTNKLAHFQETVEWFGNTDWGLGLPFPMLLATLATSAEIMGAILLANLKLSELVLFQPTLSKILCGVGCGVKP